METKQIMTLALAIAIGALVFSAALIPAISMATDTEDTFTNAGYYDMRYLESDEDVTMVWDSSNPTEITVNDEVVKLPATSSSERKTIILGADDILFRYYSDIVQITTPGGSAFAGNTILTVECTGGTITASWDTSTRTGTYTKLYIPANDGEYVMKYSDQPAFMNGDSEFIGMGVTNIDNTNEIIYVNGSIENGATFTSWNTELEFTDITVNAVEKSGYLDLYELSTITAKSGTTDITYSYFLVPAEVTAELAIHADGPTRAILGMIPIIAVLGLLIGIVTIGYIKFRN